MRIGVLDSNGAFDHPFFRDKKITRIDCKWKQQEYRKDVLGFTHAEYVCSFILKENPEVEIVLAPIVKKNRKSSVLDMLEGIERLIEEQVDMINMSLGDEYRYYARLEELCKSAVEKGILIVAAYSNNKAEATYPASFPFVIGVRCLDTKEPVQVFQYHKAENDFVFAVRHFSLYHLGIPKFYQGNSFACAVVTGFLSNYKKEYRKGIKEFSESVFNLYYPWKTLKQKNCYFLSNRVEEPLEQRFIRDVTKTVVCESFERGIEKLAQKQKLEPCQVIFIDHNEYLQLCRYKKQIKEYAANHLETEIVLRYPLFHIFDRINMLKETNAILNQFSI